MINSNQIFLNFLQSNNLLLPFKLGLSLISDVEKSNIMFLDESLVATDKLVLPVSKFMVRPKFAFANWL